MFIEDDNEEALICIWIGWHRARETEINKAIENAFYQCVQFDHLWHDVELCDVFFSFSLLSICVNVIFFCIETQLCALKGDILQELNV